MAYALRNFKQTENIVSTITVWTQHTHTNKILMLQLMSVYLRVLNVGFNIEFCGTYIVVYTLDTYYYCTRTRNVCNDRINQESPRFQRIVCALHRFIRKRTSSYWRCLFVIKNSPQCIWKVPIFIEFYLSTWSSLRIFHLHKYNNVWAHWWRYTFIIFYIHYIYIYIYGWCARELFLYTIDS